MSQVYEPMVIGVVALSGAPVHPIVQGDVWYLPRNQSALFNINWRGGQTPYQVKLERWLNNTVKRYSQSRLQESAASFTIPAADLNAIGSGRIDVTLIDGTRLVSNERFARLTIAIRDAADPIFNDGNSPPPPPGLGYDNLICTVQPASGELAQSFQFILQTALGNTGVAIPGKRITSIVIDTIPQGINISTNVLGLASINFTGSQIGIGTHEIFFISEDQIPSNKVSVTVTDTTGGGGPPPPPPPPGPGPIDLSSLSVLALPLFMGAMVLFIPSEEKRRRVYSRLRAIASGTANASKRELDKAARILIRGINGKAKKSKR